VNVPIPVDEANVTAVPKVPVARTSGCPATVVSEFIPVSAAGNESVTAPLAAVVPPFTRTFPEVPATEVTKPAVLRDRTPPESESGELTLTPEAIPDELTPMRVFGVAGMMESIQAFPEVLSCLMSMSRGAA
jgi:hypothetical protein